MKCVANYEIKTEVSVVDDDVVLRVNHPQGIYRALIKNIPRQDFTTPFLLSLHLYFEAPDLNESRSIATILLADCLNMLALTTGSSFKRHRIRQIVDATADINGMRSLLIWGDSIDHEDPQPFLNDNTVHAIERLLEFDIPQPIRRAMRWYRLGINSSEPDDQFMNFWFALEIVATFQKPIEKVPDSCPRCRSPLYCESCGTHPVHRPYPKQAIRSLIKSVDSECDDVTIYQLETARNSLAHGLTLKEIEDELPQPHEEIVDILGRILWKSLIHQFPSQMFDGSFTVGYPNTYLHRKMHGIAHAQTVVPTGPTGDLNLNSVGITARILSPIPPQSAQPTIISMSPEQYERLQQLTRVQGDGQKMIQRICERAKTDNGQVKVLVLSSDMALIRGALDQNESGDWQDYFREIMSGASFG